MYSHEFLICFVGLFNRSDLRNLMLRKSLLKIESKLSNKHDFKVSDFKMSGNFPLGNWHLFMRSINAIENEMLDFQKKTLNEMELVSEIITKSLKTVWHFEY